MKHFLALLGAGLIGAAVVVSAGWYNVSADQHLAATYYFLDFALRRAVRQHASEIEVPPLDDPALARRGLALYREHCVRCHGAPGVAPEPFALGMTPAPAMLAHTAREWRPAELYWVVKRGFKMTGMPAWQYQLSDDDLWAVVAFMLELPRLSPAQYAALQAPPVATEKVELADEKPDAERGREAIQFHACVTCHRIPGIVGANAPVGPPLEGIGSRGTIAGVLPNTFANMVRWLRDPQEVSPRSAMPDLGIDERDARDMAAYLATLR
ncbi:MAG TPA: c-type cytochrome [Burkholderiales bacterium]